MAVKPPEDESPSEHREPLLAVARQSISHGLAHGCPLPVADLAEFPAALRDHYATFVTLHRQGKLRGCIGHLTAHQPLVLDVAQNAWSSAFTDPRFAPVSAPELPDLRIEISVLTPRQPVRFDSEKALCAALRPRVDGVVLEERGHRGTFLPVVWQQLPDPADFLRQLKRKAGLPVDYWSPTLRVWRYRTISFAE